MACKQWQNKKRTAEHEKDLKIYSVLYDMEHHKNIYDQKVCFI